MVWDGTKLEPKWDEVVGRELYDHSQNSQLDNSYLDETENHNLAVVPEHASLLAQMEVLLKQEVIKWIVPSAPAAPLPCPQCFAAL